MLSVYFRIGIFLIVGIILFIIGIIALFEPDYSYALKLICIGLLCVLIGLRIKHIHKI